MSDEVWLVRRTASRKVLIADCRSRLTACNALLVIDYADWFKIGGFKLTVNTNHAIHPLRIERVEVEK